MLHQALCFSPFLWDERTNCGHTFVSLFVGFVYVFVFRVCLFWKFVPLYMVTSKKCILFGEHYEFDSRVELVAV